MQTSPNNFFLEIDASHQGLGAVLSQDSEDGRRPVAYASRGLRQSERNLENYSAMKVELLALKWAVNYKFHVSASQVHSLHGQ